MTVRLGFRARPAFSACSRIVILGVLAAAVLAPAAQAADSVQLIVRRDRGLTAAQRADVRADAGVRLQRVVPLADTELVRVPAGHADRALAALNADPDVRYAERDTPVFPASNDPYFGALWGLQNTGQAGGLVDADIDATEAWAITRGAGATIAVIDTGILTTHPDLAGQFTGNSGERGNGRETNGLDDDGNGLIDDWQGWDFVNNDSTVETQNNGHGTHAAGTIAALADNGAGVAGVAPDAKIVPVKVFGAPNTSSSAATLAVAFDYAGGIGAKVVNASLGGAGAAQIVTDAINAHPDTLYVIAAGNNGEDAANTFPCNSTAANVICVGATDNRDQPAYFSNYSATYVDVFAPGADITSTYLSNGYAAANGTSMAAPHVAGAAALLRSHNPTLTSAQAKAALLGSVDVPGTLTGLAVTAGRVNAHAALVAVGDRDGDGVFDPADNCPDHANRDQADLDADGTGDACDQTPRGHDGDADGVPDRDDQCPDAYGPAALHGCPPVADPPPANPPPAAPPGVTSIRTSGRAGKVTVRVKTSRAATVRVSAQRKTCRARKCTWHTIRAATASAAGRVKLRLTAGRYRLHVVAGDGPARYKTITVRR